MPRAFNPWAGVVPSAVVILGAVLLPGVPRAAPLAAAGAIVAAIGVLTLGRPIVRLGYKQWRETSQNVDGGYFSSEEEPPEFKAEVDEQNKDAVAVQIVGPSLVVVGTLLNGFSGFA